MKRNCWIEVVIVLKIELKRQIIFKVSINSTVINQRAINIFASKDFKMNIISKERIVLVGFSVVFCAILLACADGKEKGKQFYYRAINDRDTALLHFTKLEDNSFFGQYEIRYGQFQKDSGEVRGIISGDTIKGSFYYQPYGGGVLKRYPIALLKQKNKLLLGEGVISVYMGIPSFLKGEPIDYSNPEFVFEEIKK